MKTGRTMLDAALAVVIGCAIASLVMVNRRAAREAARARAGREAELELAMSRPTRVAAPAQSETLLFEETGNFSRSTLAPPPTPPNSPPPAHPQERGPQSRPTPAPKEPIQDPLARLALSFVGTDSGAEAYWADAINDPRLPAEERKDLIEDLNEDGLSDPRHPGIQDLPLILNRLQLIEELVPYSMDQVNWDAFWEAHKDLVNMLNGQPAQ